MRLHLQRAWPAVAVALTLAMWTCSSTDAAEAIEHRGVVYVALPDLVDRSFLDGTFELTNLGRTIEVQWAGRRVRFEEGGDRAAVDEGEAVPLSSPVLVVEGTHFLPAEESAALFGYRYEPTPAPVLLLGDRRLGLEVTPLDLPHFNTRVDDLRPVRRAVVLTAPVPARRSLHANTTADRLPSGMTLLVRREVALDGAPHAIATRCDETLETYAIALDDLRRAARDGSIDGTHLGGVFERLSELASRSQAINHGPRSDLPKTVAVTADLCWSLRSYERDFFRFVPRVAALQGEAWITLFVTGRWLEQHPEEMERLIMLSRQPGVGITWASHSWVHPKQRPFMNSYSPDEVREDNLRVEAELLRWGIVPSIFYRFPGLIHDEQRLRAVLEADLISVDCDSWVASMRVRRPPHHLWPRDGSILLIHGNGNEPLGIPRLYEWMIENPGWKWGRLHQFISPHTPSEAESAPPATAQTERGSDPAVERRFRRRAPVGGR